MSLLEQMRWYTQVEACERPAKYLICKRIPVPHDFKELSTDELWVLRKEVHQSFLELFEDIKSSESYRWEIQEPNYLDLLSELAQRSLNSCKLCGWMCNVNRNNGNTGVCKLGSGSRVSSFFHHRGEELIYRGIRGSGTIFFTSCNMRCQFCQNGDISADKDNGIETDPSILSAIIWILRTEGCHNINFVGGEPVIHLSTVVSAISKLREPKKSELREAMKLKSDWGKYPEVSNVFFQGELNAPLLFNSNFFLSEDSMKILEAIMDVWLPDLKFFDSRCSRRLSRTPRYFKTVSRWISYIYDRGESFSIRHLVMPNHVECCSIPILRWIKKHTPLVPLNIMAQYHPEMWADPRSKIYREELADISRRLRKDEFARVIAEAQMLNLNFESVSYL